MSKIEMVALDSFTASNADPRHLVAGDKFSIDADEAKHLEHHALAKAIKPISGRRTRKRVAGM